MSQNIKVLTLKKFLKSLKPYKAKALSPLIKYSHPDKLRKTVYISSSGKFYKYADFLKMFVYNLGYVPVHPVDTLGYYISTVAHKNSKTEILRDCFSLLKDVDELWVFDEKIPSAENFDALSEFSEGMLSEIYWWLDNKPNSPIKFFSYKEVGIAKYRGDPAWSLINSSESNEEADIYNARKFSVIDLGSSTVKLTICYRDSEGNLKVVTKKSITVNLAENFFEDNKLKKLPMERTLDAIKDFYQEAMGYGVVDVKLFGTGVSRKATNIKEFKEKIFENCGLNLEIISGREEGILIHEAVVESFTEKPKNLLVINVGGGTTELVYEAENTIKVKNLPIGISELNERFIKNYPVSETDFKKVVTYVKKILNEDEEIKNLNFDTLVYTGGELDYMLITGFPLEDQEGSLSHPKKISQKGVKDHAAQMRKFTLDRLHEFMPGNPQWMNGAISSNTILEVLADFFNVNTIIPSNKNLNDGVLNRVVKN